MLVSRRRGHGGGRGGTGGPGGLGSRVAHAKSRDLGSLLPNISKVRNNSACVTHGGSSMRGRGGSITVRAHVSMNLDPETTHLFDKVSFPASQNDNPILADPLETGPEIGTPSESRLFSVSRGP